MNYYFLRGQRGHGKCRLARFLMWEGNIRKYLIYAWILGRKIYMHGWPKRIQVYYVSLRFMSHACNHCCCCVWNKSINLLYLTLLGMFFYFFKAIYFKNIWSFCNTLRQRKSLHSLIICKVFNYRKPTKRLFSWFHRICKLSKCQEGPVGR